MTLQHEYPLGESTPRSVLLAATAAGSSLPVRKPITRFGDLGAHRDVVFRKLLGCSDLLSAFIGIETLAALQGRGIATISLLTLPLIVLVAQLTGRYQRDELRLRKSTLEELPALLVLAGASAITWSVLVWIGGVQRYLHGGGVVIVWVSTAAALVFTRAGARKLAALATPLERILIVGSSLPARCWPARWEPTRLRDWRWWDSCRSRTSDVCARIGASGQGGAGLAPSSIWNR